jgi:hypothetical protein
MAQDSLIKIYTTPRGPHVYIGDLRVHHWVAGLIISGIGISGLFLDKNKDRRAFYCLLYFGGLVIFLDDLPDFISFFQSNVI